MNIVDDQGIKRRKIQDEQSEEHLEGASQQLENVTNELHFEAPISPLEETKMGEHEEDGESETLKAEVELREQGESYWLPPSVIDIENTCEFASSTYHSAIPQQIKEMMDLPVILGVDEAGRGPVLGPMVYGISYSLESYLDSLKSKYGFADSKTLKDDKRQSLFKLIEDNKHELHRNVGWATRTMTARDILSGMLQSTVGAGSYNLNEQAHDATIQLIKEVLLKGVNLKKIYVDTVGPPISYQAKLKQHFPEIEITVAKKADSIYPIVSTASVVAKVTRDVNLHFFRDTILNGQKVGSGYPSDPNTSKWLHANVDKVFGWPFGLVRFLWATAKDSLLKHGAAEVIYEDQCVKADGGYKDVGSFFSGNGVNSNSKGRMNGNISKDYYHKDDVHI